MIEFAELERVRRPQAQELLVGHARPARVLGDDPGRRRHPADRRGARGRRRRVPAEVLRRVQPPARRGQARSCSSPTTWARSSASATARCCSSAARSSRSASPRASPSRYLELNFGRDAASRRGRRADADRFGDGARARSSRPGSRTSAASRTDVAAAGRALHVQGARARSTSASRTRRSASCSRTSDHQTVFVATTTLRRRSAPGASPPARRSMFTRRVRRTSSRPAATTPSPPIAHRGGGADVIDRCERDGLVRRRRRRSPRGGHRRPAARARASSAGAAAERRRGVTRASSAVDARARAGRDRGPVGAGRRLAPLRAPDLDARVHRVQAALLRLGARLPVAADAAAAAVRRPLRRLHAGRHVSATTSQYYPVALLLGHRALHVLRRGDRRAPCARSSTARTSCARSTSRGW